MNFKVTEIGELPLEWDVDTMENALDEIIDYRGKTPAKSEAGIETLSAKSVKNGYIDYSKAYFISEMTYQKFMVRGFPRKGDILLTTEAPLGLVAKLDREKVGIAQRLLTLRGKKDYLLNDYLLYYLMSNEGQHQLTSRQSGTTVTGIKQKEFRKCLISIPPFEEQKAIAHILSTLDDKIEVNNEINKTLENMAQAIFKQWFVDFEFPNEDGGPYKSSGGEMVESELGMIPKGWEVKVLGEIIDIIKQGTKPGEHLKDRKYNPIDTLPMKSIAINDFKPYEEAKSSLILFEKYDILIGAMRVYFHRVNLAPYKGITRTTTFVLRSKRIQDVPYNLFLLNMDETIDYAERTSKGSTMPYAVWDNGMSNILVAYSNQELRNKFFQIIQPMLETIMKKSAENEVLIKLRDSLLPKLMSGEIRVPLDEEGDVS